jgi:hypothetical protein
MVKSNMTIAIHAAPPARLGEDASAVAIGFLVFALALAARRSPWRCL